jgi:hypothetical protein
MGRACAAKTRHSLRQLAAANLTEVVGQLAQALEGGRVVTSFGASSELARQIRDGTPADVFVSASPDWIAFLREQVRSLDAVGHGVLAGLSLGDRELRARITQAAAPEFGLMPGARAVAVVKTSAIHRLGYHSDL